MTERRPLDRRELVRTVKVLRRGAFEALGSSKYSRPALHSLDRVLERYLPEGPGVFFEAGANDGYAQSNTYYLERFRGWSGVLVEPFPHLARRCARLRKGSRCFQHALVPPELSGTEVTLHYADLMSVTAASTGIDDAQREHLRTGQQMMHTAEFSVRVVGRTISELLDEAGVNEIDLLSLDLEGYEPEALRGLDLSRHRPRVLLVEDNTGDAIPDLLAEHYTPMDKPSPRDLLLLRK